MAMRLSRIDRAPSNTTAPTLWAQGVASPSTAQKNRAIFCRFGVWDVRADQWIIRRWQWKRNGVDISGETRPFYFPVNETVGDDVSCVETVIDHQGFTRSVETASVEIIADARTTYAAAALGFKTTQTTGSITAGTASLVVASTTGFSVNDWIIVPTGGEPGAGVRGTMGVGGAWPNLSYADAATMSADTSKASNTWAWTLDTGNTYRFRTSDSTWVRNPDGRYYYDKAIPKGLRAKITAIDGGTNTLTLDRNATETATDAVVYFDNTPALQAVSQSSTYNNSVIEFGAGTFAFSDLINTSTFVTLNRTGLTIKGAGSEATIFKSPDGFGANWSTGSVSDVHFSGIQFVGTVATDTYCFTTVSMQNIVNVPSTGRLVNIGGCTYSTVTNCKFVNGWQSITVSFGSYVWAADCEVVHGGLEMYVQWQYQWADTSYGGCFNCSVDSEYSQGSFEAFRSSNIYMVDCTGRNARAAVNTSGDVYYDNMELTCEEGRGTTPTGANFVSIAGDALIDLNGNIGNSSGDGTALQNRPVWIRNPTLTQAFPYGPSVTTLMKTIVASADWIRPTGEPGILISGGYPNKPENGGLIEAPTGGSTHLGIHSNYPIVVDRMRVKGQATGSTVTSQNAAITAGYSGGGTVKNCVVDTVFAETESNNQTNAEFEP